MVCAAAVIGIAGIPIDSVAAQSASVRTISIRDRCIECGISVAKVTTIDGAKEERFVGGANGRVARDRRGRVFFSNGSSDIPTVFDSTGRFLRMLTRTGNGPGELKTIAWIDAGRDDSVRVYSFDRVTTYGPDLVYATSLVPREPWSAGFSSVGVLSDGNLAVTTNVQARDPAGNVMFPVHIRSADGRTLAQHVLGHGGLGGVKTVNVAAARDSARFWGFELTPDGEKGYMLTLFDQRGRAHLQIVREPSWWVAMVRDQTGFVLSSVQAVHEDSQGRIVVVIRQPKPTWRQIRLDRSGAPTARYDTIIEVIDPKSGALIGHRKLTGYPFGFLGDQWVATYREVDAFPVLEIWRIQF